MKFDQLNVKDPNITISSHKSPSTIDYTQDVLDTYRFGEVGVFVIKDRKKAIFKELAKCINDVSWVIKVYHDEVWSIQFGISPFSTDSEFSVLTVLETFAKKYGLAISGYAKAATLTGADRAMSSQIITDLINVFRSIHVDKDLPKTNPRWDVKESETMVLPQFASNVRDEVAEGKFKFIIYRLEKIHMSPGDEKNFNILKGRILSGKKLTDQDKLALNTLMKAYFTEHERVELAMQYLSRGQ